jgi:hypothetical protein
MSFIARFTSLLIDDAVQIGIVCLNVQLLQVCQHFLSCDTDMSASGLIQTISIESICRSLTAVANPTLQGMNRRHYV